MPTTTQTTLHIQRVWGSGQARGRQTDDEAYRVNWTSGEFALLYLTPTSQTLEWDGVVDFGRLEDEVTGALEASGWKQGNLRDKPLRDRVAVALVVPGPDDSDDLVKCRLNLSDDFNRYVDIMKNPLAITFARYDVSDQAGSLPFFSFIAENAALQQGLKAEVALKLPKSHEWSEALLEWVIAHHRYSSLLDLEVMRGDSLSVLNRFLAGP